MDIKSKSLAIKAYCTQITGNKLFDVIKQTIEKAEPQSNLASPVHRCIWSSVFITDFRLFH